LKLETLYHIPHTLATPFFVPAKIILLDFSGKTEERVQVYS